MTIAATDIAAPPQPAPDPDSRPFWDCLREGTLAIQRCTVCAHWQFPLLERCRMCGGEVAMKALSGRGTIHTFIIEHRVVTPGFDHLLPYAIVLVTPEEAPHVRLPGRLDADAAAACVGLPVQAEVIPLPGGDFNVAVFRPAG